MACFANDYCFFNLRSAYFQSLKSSKILLHKIFVIDYNKNAQKWTCFFHLPRFDNSKSHCQRNINFVSLNSIQCKVFIRVLFSYKKN